MTKISFIGDLLCTSNQINIYKNGSGYDEIFEDVCKYFKQSDFVVGNLETPIAGEEMGYTQCLWQFNSPIAFAQSVKDSGINVVTTANNHCLNRGVEGLDKTLINLRDIGLLATGTNIDKSDKKYLMLDIDGHKIALFSYTYGTNAFDDNNYLSHKEKFKVNLLQEQELHNPITRKLIYRQGKIGEFYRSIMRLINPKQIEGFVYERKENNIRTFRQLKKDIRKSKKEGADFVIGCLHIGGQYNLFPTSYSRTIVEKAINCGVDLVVGNHEHVIHGTDVVKNKLVVYSLGNFTAYEGIHKKPYGKMSEYSIILNMYISQTKEIKYTFTVAKSIAIDRNRIKTVLLYDLINETNDSQEKNKLLQDNAIIVFKMTNNNAIAHELKLEYDIDFSNLCV